MKEIKCIVWDLDNTVWNGILLEDKNVTLKEGIDEIIKVLDSRGILHSISSKNDFETAAAKLKEFDLWEYFLYPEINWGNKSLSVKNIAGNLNIGIDSMMFIDDQQYERDEVRFSIPGIVTFDDADYKVLPAHPELNPRFVTEDSARRRKMYIENIQRTNDEEKYTGPKEEFLKSLKMELILARAEENDLKRLEELTIRTHQLNTTGRTYDYEELKVMLHSDKYLLLTAELNDKYGSYGKIGLVLIERLSDEWRIKLFILSCRVMNRGIGTILLNEIINMASNVSVKLTAEFKHTGKNRIMYVTLKFANFIESGEQDNNGLVILNNDFMVLNATPKFINLLTEKEWN